MKKYAILVLLAVATCHGGRLAAQSVDMIYVEGEVCNVVENIPLPFCEVQMVKGSKVVSFAKCDGTGQYVIPTMPAGEYTLLITQFGDTLQYVKGLRLERDSRVICRVALSDASKGQMWLPTDLKQINLGEVRIVAPTHMLAKMGLLITSAGDGRLWDFSGKMGGNRSASQSGDPRPIDMLSLVCPGLAVSSKNSVMKNELLLFGRILDTYIPPPADTAGKQNNLQDRILKFILQGALVIP